MVKYDERGRIIRVTYLRCEDICNSDDEKFACIEIDFSNRGREKRKLYNEYGQSIYKNLGIDYIVYSFDDTGKLASKSFYDKNQRKVKDESGTAQYVYSYETNSEKAVNVFRLNAKGDTITTKDSIYMVRYRLIEDDYIGETEYIYKEDNNNERVTLIKAEYDENYNLNKVSFFDKNNNLVEDKSTGSAVREFKYDRNGNKIYLANYNKDMQLSDNKITGYAIQERFYNEYSALLKMVNRKSDKSMSQVFEYKVSGTPLRVSFLDSTSNYIINPDEGFAILQHIIDEKFDNILEVRFLDQNENLIEPEKYGYAIQKAIYDEQGYLAEERYLGTDMKPRFCKKRGFSRIVYRFNEKGNQLEPLKYDCEGNLIDNKQPVDSSNISG